MGWLSGAMVYLAGPMDSTDDLGQGWRDEIAIELKKMGMIVLNPLHKPTEIGKEDAENRKQLRQMQACDDLDGVREFMKPVRRSDLRCVDLSSVVIVKWTGEPTVGTVDEIKVAETQHKPILVWRTAHGTDFNPWICAQVPTKFIFDTKEKLLEYLWQVHLNTAHPPGKEWLLFDFEKLYKEALEC